MVLENKHTPQSGKPVSAPLDIAIPMNEFAAAGGVRVLAELADAWLRLGHQVTFFVPQYSDDPYFPTRAEIKWLDDRGCVTERVETSKRPKRKGLLNSWSTLTRALNRYANSFDIILANHNLTAWPVFLSKTSAKKFYYVQAYEPEYTVILSPALKAKAFEAIAVSTYFLPLKRIVNSPVYFSYKTLKAQALVPPGIDFKVFHPKGAGIGGDWQNRTVVLGCIGRTQAYKGTSYVLDAFEILRQDGLNAELNVAFGNLPAARSVPEGCHVVVPRNDSELAAFYRSIDIMVAPGTVQLGAPHYPVMEAMACGTPVVTTGYMPATPENAWLVPTHSAEAIANAVREIITRPEMRTARQQEALKAIERFSWENVSREMLDIFMGTK